MVDAFFFDADGTLLHPDLGRMSEATEDALRQARDKGVKLILATGRNTLELDCFAHFPFDAYLTSNGQYCYDEQGVFRVVSIDSRDIAALVERIALDPFPCAFAEPGEHYINYIDQAVTDAFEEVHLPCPTIRDIADAPSRTILQLNAYVDVSRDEGILSVLPHCISERWHPLYSDLVPRGGGKGVAVREALARLGIAKERAAAIGDGANDISMLRAVGMGVAMGNAQPHVKAEAVRVTLSAAQDGVRQALIDLGLAR